MNSTSVFTSLATLNTLAAACGHRLRSIIDSSRHASIPSQILALSNEVSDLRAVLAEVEANHEIMSRSAIITGKADYTDARISSLMERAESNLVELDKIISSSVKLARDKYNVLVFRKAVWLRSKESSIAMIQDLREIKQDIMLLMASKAAYVDRLIFRLYMSSYLYPVQKYQSTLHAVFGFN